MSTTKFSAVGNSTGLRIAKEDLAKAGFQKGDAVDVKASPGKIELTKSDSDYSRSDDIFKRGRSRYARALRELSK